MAKNRYPLPRSSLVGMRGAVGGSDVEVVEPGTSMVVALDTAWPPLRPQGAEHKWWEWRRIRQRSKDILALQDEEGILAVWCSGRRVLELESGAYYRLDYLEVHPQRLGEGWGAVALAAICARARELGADEIVLGALPQAVPYWTKVAEPSAPRGWNCAKELEPFVIGSDVVANLEKVFHAQFSPE